MKKVLQATLISSIIREHQHQNNYRCSNIFQKLMEWCIRFCERKAHSLAPVYRKFSFFTLCHTNHKQC